MVLDCADRDGAEEGEKSLRDSWNVVEPGDIPLSSSINGEDVKTKRMTKITGQFFLSLFYYEQINSSLEFIL